MAEPSQDVGIAAADDGSVAFRRSPEAANRLEKCSQIPVIKPMGQANGTARRSDNSSVCAGAKTESDCKSMRDFCKVKIFREPIEISFDELEHAPFSIFFATGIFNPWGPTFQFFASVGDEGWPEHAAMPIICAMLNPFKQTVHRVGEFLVAEGVRWRPEDVFDPLIDLQFGSTPTLLLIGNAVPPRERLPMATKIVSFFGNEIGRVYQGVRDFMGDPWGRIDHVVTVDSGGQSVEKVSQLFAELLLRPDHFWPELRAIVQGWRGSYEKTLISDSLRERVFPEERFADFLWERIFPAVWIPEIPKKNLS